MRKFVLFVPDLSSGIGLGHFYRCLRLATYLKSVGWAPAIIAPEIGSTPRALLNQNKIAFHRVDSLDSTRVLDFIKRLPRTSIWVITDHYKIAAAWERKVRTLATVKIAAFDDDDGRRHSCDILIRTNELSKPEVLIKSKYTTTNTRMLIGPKYYIPDLSMRVPVGKTADTIKNILFFMGGTAAAATFIKFLKATVAAVEGDNIQIKAIAPLGFNLTLPKELRRVELIKNYKLLGKHLAKTDLYVGSGGTITFDRLLFNIPGIVFSMASNQDKLNSALARLGANIFLGSVQKLTEHKLSLAIQSVVKRPRLFQDLKINSRGLVDGRGGQRLATHLLHFPIVLRPARKSDEKNILSWRNNPAVRKASIQTIKISALQHHHWFQQKLHDNYSQLLIAESAGTAIAVLRYDFSKNKSSAVVSIFLTPKFIGSGLGSEVLKAGTVWLRKHFRKIKRINAVIRSENIASIKSFTSAGYRKLGRYYVTEV